MNVTELKIEKDKAREMYERYMEHRKCLTPADAEIAAIYRMIASGKTVIRALESIKAAGLDAQGLPKLAIARADLTEISLYTGGSSSSVLFRPPQTTRYRSKKLEVTVPWEGWTNPQFGTWSYEAVVPLIPVHLRPKRGLQNYHILWEAEWTRKYPVDPYLLRRFGGDAWVVVAAWDLTEVERAVMASRIQH